jgi:glycosyltransferase involved in cell wall biosynthesis
VSEHVKNNLLTTKKISPVFLDMRVFKAAFIEQELTLYNPPSRPEGECITLVNANAIKGLFVFTELAKHFPDRKFLGVRPYYNFIQTPNLPNIEWMDIQEDIRDVLKKTRILLMPSIYETWGRIAFEAMYNGIPVLYTKPMNNPEYPSGSTEGMQAWIQDNGFACDRTSPDDWITNIQKLDDPSIYAEYSDRAYNCTRKMNIFQEITDIENTFLDYATKYAKAPKTKGEEPAQAAPRVTSMSVAPPPGSRMAFGLRGGRFGMRR